LGKIYTKIQILAILATAVWHEATDLGHPPRGEVSQVRSLMLYFTVVKVAQKIAHGACRYCIAQRRLCILIVSDDTINLINY